MNIVKKNIEDTLGTSLSGTPDAKEKEERDASAGSAR